MFIYTVTAELPSEEVARDFLSWLEDDHLREVVDAGALDAEAVRLDGDAHVVECRYRFASREAFAAYEAGPAERLRADGRARFGPESGVRMRRATGELKLRRP